VLLSDILPKIRSAPSTGDGQEDAGNLTRHLLPPLRREGDGAPGGPAALARYGYATKAGISIAIKDMVIPAKKQEMLEGAQKEVAEIENQYLEGLITDGERYNKVIDIWAQVTEQWPAR